jgi:hypothetical protein
MKELVKLGRNLESADSEPQEKHDANDRKTATCAQML